MSEERFLNIEHTLERVDDDLTNTTKDVEALKRENAELKRILNEQTSELRELIGTLARSLRHGSAVFAYESVASEIIQKHLAEFNDKLTDVITRTPT
jgi:predicted RNase H-like nuclease (RuvC/YqgF family)